MSQRKLVKIGFQGAKRYLLVLICCLLSGEFRLISRFCLWLFMGKQ